MDVSKQNKKELCSEENASPGGRSIPTPQSQESLPAPCVLCPCMLLMLHS